MLKVNQLDKTYGQDKHSLKSVSFTAQPGEVTAIIGPSGAGKTTILRSVNQLIRDDGGQILLDDQDIRQANKAELRKIRHHIGMIFQNYNLISPQSLSLLRMKFQLITYRSISNVYLIQMMNAKLFLNYTVKYLTTVDLVI